MFNFWRSKTLYRLPNGNYADPLKCYREMIAKGVTTLMQQHSQSSTWQKAEADLCNLVRETFNLKPLDVVSGKGFTDEDCLDILVDFMGYIEKKGSRGNGSQTIVPVMAPQEN